MSSRLKPIIVHSNTRHGEVLLDISDRVVNHPEEIYDCGIRHIPYTVVEAAGKIIATVANAYDDAVASGRYTPDAVLDETVASIAAELDRPLELPLPQHVQYAQDCAVPLMIEPYPLYRTAILGCQLMRANYSGLVQRPPINGDDTSPRMVIWRARLEQLNEQAKALNDLLPMSWSIARR